MNIRVPLALEETAEVSREYISEWIVEQIVDSSLEDQSTRDKKAMNEADGTKEDVDNVSEDRTENVFDYAVNDAGGDLCGGVAEEFEGVVAEFVGNAVVGDFGVGLLVGLPDRWKWNDEDEARGSAADGRSDDDVESG